MQTTFIYKNKNYAPQGLLDITQKPSWLGDVCDTVEFWMGTDTHLQLQTSGSTGTPKIISLDKSVLLQSATATNTFFCLDHTSHGLLALPASFIGGKMMVIRALVAGFKLTLQQPKAILENHSEIFDFVALTPQQAAESLPFLAGFKTILLGGAPISATLENQIIAHNTNAYHSFGMTETASHIAVRKLGSLLYTALPGVSFSVVDDCLRIHAPAWQQPDLQTNDLVRLQNSHQFEWLGRADFAINSGGIKLHPEAIEKKLEAVLKTRFFISKVPHDMLGEAVVLIVEGTKNPLLNLDFLPKYERPKQVFYTPRFAETTNGKVNRPQTLALATKK